MGHQSAGSSDRCRIISSHEAPPKTIALVGGSVLLVADDPDCLNKPAGTGASGYLARPTGRGGAESTFAPAGLRHLPDPFQDSLFQGILDDSRRRAKAVALEKAIGTARFAFAMRFRGPGRRAAVTDQGERTPRRFSRSRFRGYIVHVRCREVEAESSSDGPSAPKRVRSGSRAGGRQALGARHAAAETVAWSDAGEDCSATFER